MPRQKRYKTKAAATAARVLKIHDEPKSVRFSTKMTPTGKAGLEALAEEMGLSLAEFVEQIGRGEFELVRKAS